MRGTPSLRHTIAGSANVEIRTSQNVQQTTNPNESLSRDQTLVEVRGNPLGRQHITTTSHDLPQICEATTLQQRPSGVASGILQPLRSRPVVPRSTAQTTLPVNRISCNVGNANQTARNRINSGNLPQPQGQGTVPRLVNERGMPAGNQLY